METKKTEKQLIFELIRFKDFEGERIAELLKTTGDFPWVLGQILFNRMGGVTYYVLKEACLLTQVNREFRNSLKNAYEMNRLKTQAYREALAEFGEIFNNAPFPYAFLKGAFLTSTLYPEGLRTSNDYDILVSQKNIASCESLLKEHGFIQGYYRQGEIFSATREQIVFSRMNRGETVPFLKRGKYSWMDVVEVDVNFSLDYKAKNEVDVVGDLLGNTQSFDAGQDASLRTLSHTDFLIHLCVHLFKEATVYNWVEMQRDLSLYKFCDIYAFLLASGNETFFQRLSSRISSLSLNRECYYSLQFCAVIYPSLNRLDGFNNLMKAIRPDDLAYMKQIIYPARNILYSFNMSLSNWMLCVNRKSYLIELK